VGVAATAVLLVVGTWALRATDGPAALVAILLPHLLLVALLAATIGWCLHRSLGAGATLVVLVLVTGAQLGSEWLSLPRGTDAPNALTLLSWNLEAGARSADTLPDVLLAYDADIVALQELTRPAAAAIEADARLRARYPYRVADPNDGAIGMGILSAFPIRATTSMHQPPFQAVTLDLGGSRPLHVVNAHPLPGRIRTVSQLRLPVAFDGSGRDASLRAIRAGADEFLATGDPVIMAGDFNVAPTEAAYEPLARGLLDVHVEVGLGPGWTWRPSRMEGLGIGLLRIDYVFSSPAVVPVSTRVDCSQPGDHCAMVVRLGVPR
jgi:endonuclease/exonuclease/phosphatase (EEP) superfamily protein YafD